MIKKFSENINEDYFSKLANRKDNGDKRIEQKTFGNVSKMKPFLFTNSKGYSLYMSDIPLENNGQNLFSYSEVKDVNLGDWRLLTNDDVLKLFTGVNYDVIQVSNLKNDKYALKFENGYTLYAYGYINCGLSTIYKDGKITNVNNLLVHEDTLGEYLVLPGEKYYPGVFKLLRFGIEYADDGPFAHMDEIDKKNIDKYKYSIILVKDVEDDKEIQ